MPADPPSPPESPTVSVKDNSTLAVSWTAPWSFPINHYTLRMINASSSELIGLWVTNHTELMVNKSWPSDCDLLVFTVEAFTDVGPSGPSEPTLTGFPTSESIVRDLFPRLKQKVHLVLAIIFIYPTASCSLLQMRPREITVCFCPL